MEFIELIQAAPVAAFIFLITIATSLVAWYQDDTLLSRFIFSPTRIHFHKEYHRFFTSGLIHADGMHLFFNMFSFYIFGFELESRIGHWQFGVLYIFSLFLSHLPSYFQNRTNHAYLALGASGAISALVFSFIFIDPFNKFYYFFIPLDAWLFGILYVIYSYYGDKQQFDNIGHSAHLYGALSGLVLTPILFPESIKYWMAFLNLN